MNRSQRSKVKEIKRYVRESRRIYSQVKRILRKIKNKQKPHNPIDCKSSNHIHYKYLSYTIGRDRFDDVGFRESNFEWCDKCIIDRSKGGFASVRKEEKTF